MKTGSKEYYADYYAKHKNEHSERNKKFKDENPELIKTYYENSVPIRKAKYEFEKEIDLVGLQAKWRKKSINSNQQRREFTDEYKKDKYCVKCRENRIHVLDFHHLDPSQKEFNIGERSKHGLKRIWNEMEKCILLCRNCHSDFHHLERQNNITIQEYLDL